MRILTYMKENFNQNGKNKIIFQAVYVKACKSFEAFLMFTDITSIALFDNVKNGGAGCSIWIRNA